MEMLELPLVGNIKDSDVPSPEEYTYWKDRKTEPFILTMKLMKIIR